MREAGVDLDLGPFDVNFGHFARLGRQKGPTRVDDKERMAPQLVGKRITAVASCLIALVVPVVPPAAADTSPTTTLVVVDMSSSLQQSRQLSSQRHRCPQQLRHSKSIPRFTFLPTSPRHRSTSVSEVTHSGMSSGHSISSRATRRTPPVSTGRGQTDRSHQLASRYTNLSNGRRKRQPLGTGSRYHGTAVAGIIARQPAALGGSSIAHDAEKLLDSNVCTVSVPFQTPSSRHRLGSRASRVDHQPQSRRRQCDFHQVIARGPELKASSSSHLRNSSCAQWNPDQTRRACTTSTPASDAD